MGIEPKAPSRCFTPLELTASNVQEIYNRCLAQKGTPRKNAITCKIDGNIVIKLNHLIQPFRSDSGPRSKATFDKQAIAENLQNIEYLYGQLKVTWAKTKEVGFGEGGLTYPGFCYPLGSETDCMFILLGTAAKIIRPYNLKKTHTTFVKQIAPTLSPTDSDFAAWFPKYEKLAAENAPVEQFFDILPE